MNKETERMVKEDNRMTKKPLAGKRTEVKKEWSEGYIERKNVKEKEKQGILT